MTKKKKTKAANDNGLPAAHSLLVGYGSPPKHTQFKKGVSGNPTGRPKGTAKSDYLKPFHQKVTITVNGKTKKVPGFEAVATKTLSMAMGGDQACIKLVLGLAKDSQFANDHQTLAMGSSFNLTSQQLAAIEKSTLLKGIK